MDSTTCDCCYCSGVHDTDMYVSRVSWMHHAVWHIVDGNGVLSAKETAFVSSELHCLLTSTGYGPRLHIVRILNISAMISEVVCVTFSASYKESFLTDYDCIRLYISAVIKR